MRTVALGGFPICPRCLHDAVLADQDVAMCLKTLDNPDLQGGIVRRIECIFCRVHPGEPSYWIGGRWFDHDPRCSAVLQTFGKPHCTLSAGHSGPHATDETGK